MERDLLSVVNEQSTTTSDKKAEKVSIPRLHVVSKPEFIRECSAWQDCTLSEKQLEQAYDVIFRTYKQFLLKHRSIKLPRLGQILTWVKPSGKAYNPRDKTYVRTPARWVIRATVNNTLRRQIKKEEVQNDQVSQ